MSARIRGVTLAVAPMVVVVLAIALNSAGAQAPATPGLVSATILSNNFDQGERSTVQYTFSEPITLSGAAASYLSDFSLGRDTHPVAATVEPNGFIVEADFPPNINVGEFAVASVSAGAVGTSQGGVQNGAASTDLTITTEGATAAPDLRGADLFNVYTSIPPLASWIEFFFDKPIESVVPSDFGYYAPGATSPTMGIGIPPGGFTPGSTAVTIEFPGATADAAQGIFALRGAATGLSGLPSPDGVSGSDGGGNVRGLPGLLSASSENVASVTKVNPTTYDFTFNAPPTTATASDFFLYTSQDSRLAGSTDAVSGQTVEVTFPGAGSADVVRASVVPGAVTVNGVSNTVGAEPIGPPAGGATATASERGIGFTPTGPSIASSPTTISDAPCGPGDHPQTGLQGEVPVSLRSDFKGFNCNVKELAQYPSAGSTWDGGTWVGSWAGHCVYLSTAGEGVVVVINASNPDHPVESTLLNPPSFLNAWETLKYNPQRHLLAAVSFENPYFAIYDVSDCAHPVLDASINLGPQDKGHAGSWAPDGKTFYATQDYRGVGGLLAAIDTSDPHHPRLIANLSFPGNGRPHDLSLNRSGTIAYISQPGQFGSQGFPGPNGLVVLNVSQVQDRVPDPKVSVISTLFWNNGGQAQQSLPVTYHGQQYLITTDELGSGGVGGRAGACARGLSPFGFAQILNVSNPDRPYIVSKLRLGVDNPVACAINDDAPNTGIFGYDSHYCNVNRLNDPTMLGCGQFEAGLRIYDIRNPMHPREIAYFDPPPGHGTGSEHAMFAPAGFTQTDWASSPPVFVGCNVWDQFQDNGYVFLTFTHGPGRGLCRQDSSTANSDVG